MANSYEGVPLGTPRFLSPEQVQCHEVDARTDVYGAGMVVYELLTGRDPFFHIRGYAELLEAHVSERPRPPSLVGTQPIAPVMDAIVMTALAKRPEDRHASAEAFSTALAHALRAQVAPAVAPPRFHAQLTGWLALAGAALGVIIVLLIQRIL